MSKKALYIYYFIMLLLLCSWTDMNTAPNIVIRLTYITALFFPALKYAPQMFPPVFICFIGTSTYYVSSSFMPNEIYYYAVILFVIALFINNKKFNKIKIPILVIFFIYVTAIDIFNNGELENIEYAMFITLMLLSYIDLNKINTEQYSYAFIIISIVVCITFFTIGKQYVVEIQGQDRTMWEDPNYLGCVVGMGVICAYFELMRKNYANKFVKLLYLFTIFIGILMLLLNASRGAALSTAIGITFITMFSNISNGKKISAIIIVVIAIVILYQLDMFSALQERMESDDGTGNARTTIWAYKTAAFFLLPTYYIITGIGYYNGFMLGTYDGYGFHSDYVAFFVDYGIIGTLLLITLFAYPLYLSGKNKNNRGIIYAMTFYLMANCATLEPLTGGRVIYFLFYLYIIIIAKKQNYSNNKSYIQQHL